MALAQSPPLAPAAGLRATSAAAFRRWCVSSGPAAWKPSPPCHARQSCLWSGASEHCSSRVPSCPAPPPPRCPTETPAAPLWQCVWRCGVQHGERAGTCRCLQLRWQGVQHLPLGGGLPTPPPATGRGGAHSQPLQSAAPASLELHQRTTRAVSRHPLRLVRRHPAPAHQPRQQHAALQRSLPRQRWPGLRRSAGASPPPAA